MTKNKLGTYFKQRFPIGGVLFIALTTSFTTTGLYAGVPTTAALVTTLLVAVNFIAFLLRQRVVDEFKDRRHDAVNFPDRPFQRGIVNAKTLIIIGVSAFGVELGAVYLAGGLSSLAWYAPVVIYSLLMMREFFLGGWLEKHFSAYFILHEIVFVLYAVWLVHLFDAAMSWDVLAWIVYFVSLLVSIEVGRKFSIRKDPKGNIVKDTYTAVWGRAATITVLGLLLMSAGIALSFAESSLIFVFVSAIAALVISLVDIKKDRVVQALLIAHALLLVAIGGVI